MARSRKRKERSEICERTHPQGVQPEGSLYLGCDEGRRGPGLGHLQTLTDDLVLAVLSHLPARDLCKAAICSQAFYCFCSHEELWKTLILEERQGDFQFQTTWKTTYLNALSKALQGASAYGAKGWPACSKWTRKHLLQAFAEHKVVAGEMNMRLQDYLAYLDRSCDEMPLYLFDKHFTSKAPGLLGDFQVPACFEDDLFSVLGDKRPDHRWLIWGPERSGSTFHKDPNATSAWNAVVRGSKKWILYPPHVLPPGVHASPDGADVASPVSLVEWFLKFYPQVHQGPVKPLEGVVRQGEVLFVPHGWWHLAINLEETVAVTQNFVSRVNLPHVLGVLRSRRADLVSGCALHERGLLHDKFVEALQQHHPEMLEEATGADRGEGPFLVYVKRRLAATRGVLDHAPPPGGICKMFRTTVTFLLLQGLLCNAAPIVFFGDSLSDNGNGYAATAKFVLRTTETYPEAPYFRGRWSNGPVWIEVAAQMLGANLTDYAAGGATSGAAPAQVPNLPVGFGNLTLPTTVLSQNLFQQLDSHFLVTGSGALNPEALYIVFIGANDYLSIAFAKTSVTASQVVGNIEDALSQLAERGAQRFLVATVPPLQMLAVFNDPVYGTYPADLVQEVAAQVEEHNMLLQDLAASFPSSHAGTNVSVFDFATTFGQILQSAASLGITNTMQPCYVTAPILSLSQDNAPFAQPIGLGNGTLCADPDTHANWDQFHPTAVVHQQIGQRFAQAFGNEVNPA
ncbi:hypothetical protein WJX73_000849 [Symbiochloris irregularis]|uniref:JmjC domain-containing protein n=1 Tax=Symbiochloris irregularis TaxID=706552 RepID=A0AAW1PQA3_9CHLO